MNNDLLKDELRDLQLEYKEILKTASKDIFNKSSMAVIDEINVFWHRNKKLVHCILKNMCNSYDAYIYTGATILDMEDFEHYPFVTLGKYHFWDDPIYNYAMLVGKTPNSAFDKKIRDQIIETINENIKILDNAADIIFILPIRLLSEIDTKLVHEAGMQAFLSMFNGNFDFEYYKKNFKTIEDIKNGLSSDIEKTLIFSVDDDNSLDLEIRFNNFKKMNTLPLPDNATDAQIFWLCVYGYFTQAFDIIFMCAQYQLIPYICFDVTFKHIIRLASIFEDNREVSGLIFKCAVAHTLYKIFDKEKGKKMNFRKYYQYMRCYNFEGKLFSDLQRENITISNPSITKVISIIEKNFKNFYSEYKGNN